MVKSTSFIYPCKGPCWRVMETGHPSTLVVEAGLNSAGLISSIRLGRSRHAAATPMEASLLLLLDWTDLSATDTLVYARISRLCRHRCGHTSHIWSHQLSSSNLLSAACVSPWQCLRAWVQRLRCRPCIVPARKICLTPVSQGHQVPCHTLGCLPIVPQRSHSLCLLSLIIVTSHRCPVWSAAEQLACHAGWRRLTLTSALLHRRVMPVTVSDRAFGVATARART